MDIQDNDVKDFFDDLRRQEAQEEIPAFETMVDSDKPSYQRWYWWAAAAAVIFIGSLLVWSSQTVQENADYELVISIEIPVEATALEGTTTGMYEWESATSSLIND